MFEAICGAKYKTERGYNRHLEGICRTCSGITQLQEVGGALLKGEESRDITINQVNWLLGLSAKAALPISRYTRRSRRWFTIPGERPIHVTVWPNGAGVIFQGLSEAEQQKDQQARIVEDKGRIYDKVMSEWEDFTPKQQEAWKPVLDQLIQEVK